MLRKLAIVTILLCFSLTFTFRAVFSQSDEPGIYSLAWNLDGTKLAVGRSDGTVEITDSQGKSLGIYNVFRVPQTVITVAWSPREANRLAVGGTFGSAKVLDLSKSPPTTSLELSPLVNYVGEIAWSPDGNKIAVYGDIGIGPTSESTLTIWDSFYPDDLLAADHRSPGDYMITQVAWDPADSDLLAITSVMDNYGAEIRLWDVRQNKVLWRIQEPDMGILSLAWSPDGQQLAFAGQSFFIDPDIWQYDLDDPMKLHLIVDTATGLMSPSVSMGDIGNLVSLAWTPNQYLAASGLKFQIWDMNYAHIVNTSDVYCEEIAWSPTGDLACANGGLKIISGLGRAPETPMPQN